MLVQIVDIMGGAQQSVTRGGGRVITAPKISLSFHPVNLLLAPSTSQSKQ